MNIIVYFFVALIAAGSVLFGLDFVSAPMSPMPASKYALRAAVPPAPPVVATADAKAEPKTEAAASVAVASNVAAKPPAIVAPAPAAVPAPRAPTAIEQQPASIVTAEQGTVAAAPPAPRCDVDACSSAYRTFDATDCTYKPSEGPRRFCTKGTPPAAAPVAAAAPATPPDVRAQACNVAACSQSYPRSFSAADCTFLPAQGPRRVCAK